MKPAPFDYRCAGSVDEALQQLADRREDIAPLAGGQSLMPLLNLRQVRPAVVLDLNRIPGLAEVQVADQAVRIGAMTRLRTIERSAVLRSMLAVLPEAAERVATTQIRSRSTLGGSLCHADPAGQLPTVIVALGAVLRLRSASGERVVAAADFFTGPHVTARRPDELLISVEFQRHRGFFLQHRGLRFGYEAVTGRGRCGLPLVGVCFGVRTDGHLVQEARIAAGGVADRPSRLYRLEEAIVGLRLDSGITAAIDATAADVEPPSDLRGSSAYRRDLLRTVIRRAAARAAAERSSL